VREGGRKGDVEGVEKLRKGKGKGSVSDLRASTKLKETAGGGTVVHAGFGLDRLCHCEVGPEVTLRARM